MTSVLLVYPFFKLRRDRSVFRFPPLGIAYIASSLQSAGHKVTLLDCTFRNRNDALKEARAVQADVVGIYCMATLLDDCLWFSHELRDQTRWMIAGGPLPTCGPETFIQDFDYVVLGEGEKTIVELLEAFNENLDGSNVSGIAYRNRHSGEIVYTQPRSFIEDLDRIPFPARELLPNTQYQVQGLRKYGFSISTVMSTRGCPYRCEFCSNVVFGGSYRERSALNVVDEIEHTLALGYDRISFADDVFTLNHARVMAICDEIRRRGLHFGWECLGRVDSMDAQLAETMKSAGCRRIYFGIESANEAILELMNKRITPIQARKAVEIAHTAGIEVGAFFIVGYPGDTNETVLQTLHFAADLPLDYLGLSMPYPLPGTKLFARVRERIDRDWHPEESLFGSHVLIFNADFSELKMWFGIIKGHAQFRMKRLLKKHLRFLPRVFEKVTDWIFTILR